jgi:hypothetical protein
MMTSLKLRRMLVKYAEQPPIAGTAVIDPEKDALIDQQRERLTQFAHQLQIKLQVLVAEMENDLHTLKERQFDSNSWKHFVGIWRHLVGIVSTFQEEDPYQTGFKILQYIESPQTQAIIDNLDFLAKHHLEKSRVDFSPHPMLKHPTIRSLQLLLSLAKYVENYMKNHPLIGEEKPITPLPAGTTTPTWRPPAK